ncbi:MAG: cupin domain-containing protein [Caulobacteraceae bacterium]|nr:MAG: cupin domain-containing protein [Caulobacteraceae bacterium]
MPRIDVAAAPFREGTDYPAPHDAPVRARRRWRLGDAAGLTAFGVNRLELDPGVWSSQRHNHSLEDEFVIVLQGEVVLVEDDGETVLRAGDCAAFKAGTGLAHHLINRSDQLAVVLEVGSREPQDASVYPDIDMVWPAGGPWYTHADGRPYPAPQD